MKTKWAQEHTSNKLTNFGLRKAGYSITKKIEKLTFRELAPNEGELKELQLRFFLVAIELEEPNQ